MSDPKLGEIACPLAAPCPDRAFCPAAGGSLSLAEALARYAREVRHAVCDTGRYRCAYFAWGEGPPLVFISGLGDGPRGFVPVIARLARRFRCLTYRLPAGGSDGARLDRLEHADLVADLFALLDHAGARQAYLFGASFGSTVALAALRARPDRLPRAVLQGGFARRPLAAAERLLAGLARWWPGTMRALPLRTAVLRRGHAVPFACCPPEVWPFYVEENGTTPIAAFARRALLLHRTDLRPLLPEVRQPVLLVCGDRDPLVGKDCEEVLLRGLPSAGRVELPHCGHFPYLTHPDLLADVVARFLTPPGERAAGPVPAVCAEDRRGKPGGSLPEGGGP
jgi:pimeloyl-ACP methyl ester carboxylesterase